MNKIIKIIRNSKSPDEAKDKILKSSWTINKSSKLVKLIESKKSKGSYKFSEPE